MSNNTKLFCLFLKAQKQDKLSEQGYAMAVVSILSIIMFSLLAASLIFSNLAKSRTDAFVDTQSSFAVAESGLNKRAAELQAKLETYSGIAGVSNPNKKVDSCFDDKFKIPTGKKQSTPTETDDFECRNYSFDSSNNISRVAAAGGGISLDSNGQDTNKYLAYTFVADKTRYVGASPDSTPIPVGEPFAGLNAAEYRYVIQSTGRKPVNSGAVDLGGNNANLSMAFVTRVVPLFQFAIFYNGDLEFNSTSKMRVRGRVHSNANIYVQPAGIKNEEEDSVTDFLSIVTSAGKIYNRIDAWDQGIGRTGITRILLTGKTGDCDTPGNCQEIPAYNSSVTDPLTLAQINAFTGKELMDSDAGAVELKVPSPGFTRKRNYADNSIGLYYARADMRLEMVPDRDVTARPATTAPWTRNKAIIPFNFTSVTTGTANCTSTLPAPGSDPAADYIPSVREKFSTRQCNKFTKGQLQSLRQPVLKLNNTNSALEPTENNTLGGAPIATAALPADFTTKGVIALPNSTKDKILRALQVALVSTPAPVALDTLDKNLNLASVYDADPNLNSFKTEFQRLVESIFPVTNPVSPSAADLVNINIKNTLLAASPNQIAALRAAWFLPAPIQRVEKLANTDSANPRSSGFYDGREKRWITMLQTNIASLSVWNRDGLYVKADDEFLTSAYVASSGKRDDAFNFGSGANFTDGLAFDRPAADYTKPAGSLQYLGLGSSDRTEGGLIIHASVSDDLDGNGTMDGNDITVDKADPHKRILKKKPDNSDDTDPKTGAVIVIDYHRKYPGQITKTPFTPESPFAFAFNGGNYLPSALTLSSDQSIYIQGNFNNNASNSPPIPQPDTGVAASSPDSLPASIIADTITALSNQCVDNSGTSPNNVPASQLKCGVNISAGASPDGVARSMAINAAFLSNTNLSNGNYRVGGGSLPAVTARQYSGGVNNYIRLLENWGNQFALNYSGSLISLGTPLEYSGEYVSGGGETATRTRPAYYNIPLRNFNYDTKFNKNENVPPLTPKASYVQQNGFNRAY
jgi:hypothetical protein